LHDLKTRPLRVSPRIEKRRHASQTPREQHDHKHDADQPRRAEHAQIQQARARREQQHNARHAEHHRRPEVRLRRDQHHEQPGHQHARHESFPERLLLARAAFEKAREKDHESEFRQLRRLQREAARQPDPAVRAVDAREQKHRHQKHDRPGDQPRDDASITQPPVVELHHAHHRQQARHRPDRLLLEIVILRAVFGERQISRRAIDHHDAEQRQPHRRGKQPLVSL
jgi:hypothetical protein